MEKFLRIFVKPIAFFSAFVQNDSNINGKEVPSTPAKIERYRTVSATIEDKAQPALLLKYQKRRVIWL